MGDRAARLGGAVARAWRSFGRWRWTRPFWGGLLLVLAGLELFATTQGGADLNGLSVHVGPSGYLSWLIPAVLVTCGLLIWFSPAQRVFYSVIGAVTSVFSLMAVNLGGFFLGLLLGAVGAVLAFGWTPPSAQEPEPGESELGEPATEELTGPKGEGDGGPGMSTGPESRSGTVDEQAQKRHRGYDESAVLRPATEPTALPSAGPVRRARRTPWMSMWIVMMIPGVVLIPGARAAHARPCPTPSGSASPSASRSPGPIEGILNGIGGLLGLGGTPGTAASPSPSPSVSEGACGGTEPPPDGDPEPEGPGDPEPGNPGGPSAPGTPAKPGPGGSGTPSKPADQVKQLGIPAGVPPVAMRPSLLTGTKVEMWNLGIDGIVDMPRADGSTIKALQFSMTKAYTHDFRLDTPRHQELSPITSSRLGVEGDVKFYATRFTGTLLGLTITLTPESPLPPDGIPIAVPYIAFGDPSMDLLLATARTLTGPDLVDTV
ncbi:DUF6114 domain-containing protein [Catenuloplanes sp. NPDC051500]|uniref:DUF6114 domain-containing protein n=1 Tax=Catenuloplanes sp. NPDC051500 TaxID=3363959 RepID=UPI00378AF7BA